MPTPLLIDTDLGTDADDVVALAFALTDPRCDVVGITVVNGDVQRRARLVTAILELANRTDIPVGLGASEPIGASRCWTMPVGVIADGPYGPLPESTSTAEAVITSVLTNATEPVHLAGIGAWSNLARVLTAHPELHERVARIHLMGACLDTYAYLPGGRRLDPIAEFNLNGDVAAASQLLDLPSSIPLQLAPLNITNELLLAADDLVAIASGGKLGEAVNSHVASWIEFLRTRTTNPDVLHLRLHDPLTVVGIVAPEVLTTETRRLRLEGEAGDAFLVPADDGRDVAVVTRADEAALRRELVSAITGASMRT